MFYIVRYFTKYKTWIVDDDIMLGNVVTLALNEAGYEAFHQPSLTGIIMLLHEFNPDIIILDVEIGEKNGIDVAPKMKAYMPHVPILFVSSHIETTNVIKALGAGGAFYLRKPFEMEELIAYIKSNTAPFHVKNIAIGLYQLDVESKCLLKNNKVERSLSSFDFKLLRLLALNRNEVVKRPLIIQELWGEDIPNEKSLNNYISKLRQYLTADSTIKLASIKNVGYMLIDNNRH